MNIDTFNFHTMETRPAIVAALLLPLLGAGLAPLWNLGSRQGFQSFVSALDMLDLFV